ncbi:trans-resveratrol di-O-methyltransferase-like [Coffea eugenioides]|uniref:trans-resveratrol di-O-methyltransferase-like n=1 Tax=Coffea eugenioides TaxID=49369 RepID=UPI000F61047B|nr:trans-resveratrol di-O-methyltransferase-like [Coffea eugenioides]XP_027166612.1 trans-resveratrol di-O-methyltransferase-like [Coffea eugenioides]
MDLGRNGDANELLQAQAHILNRIFNFINSMPLKCAIQLGIPDIIHKHGKPMTVDELTNALPIGNAKAPFVYCLKRILIRSGFFIEAKISQHDEEEANNKSLAFVGGDIFVAIPPAGDVIMKWMLHDWNDEECVQMLRKCKEAIPSKENGGKVIIIDMVLNDQQKGADDHEGNKEMRRVGKTLSEAGFNDYKITLVLGLRSLIEVYY